MYVAKALVLNLSSGRILQIWMVAWVCEMLPLQCSLMIARQAHTNACCAGEMKDLVGLLGLTCAAPIGAMRELGTVALEVVSG